MAKRVLRKSSSSYGLLQIFGMAEQEMEYRVDLFNRYKETELNMGENSCIDRCVSKYWQVTNLTGQLLASNRPPM
ncbi:mitochondrial import inner membrane translocase subunit TIM10 isoform X8 [Elaeis guineensis]|uniref:Mitochondrial import inner membrane translocase subunit n=1 Tax=Elaeis guineensis var. tenera TaxID=51953 RepID=A0A8N4IFP7_ELAGV|nr:mitochondrial import inner membrane translocase subunit TIM10 isoform X7 [Elaeis guineensis]